MRLNVVQEFRKRPSCLLCFVFSLNNMEELLMVERGAFQNLPEMVKLELCNNPQLSYVDPQAFRFLRPPKFIDFKMSC